MPDRRNQPKLLRRSRIAAIEWVKMQMPYSKVSSSTMHRSTVREAFATAEAKSAAHIPQLDGIRGLAILLVMVLHFTNDSGIVDTSVAIDRFLINATHYGWVGVDLFFVLSGFLITGILFDAKGSAGYFRNFYARRVLRIFPLYFGFLTVWFFVLPHVYAWPAEMVYPVRRFWSWTYLTNVSQALAHTLAAAPPYVGHFWSLAVEEQFYLLWPFLVFLFSRRTLLHVCGICVLAAPLLRFWLWWIGNPIAAYVLAPARMDALAVGAALALLWRGPSGFSHLRRCAWPAFCTGFALFVFTANLHTNGRLDGIPLATLGYSSLALLFAALIMISVEPGHDRAAGFFARRELRFLGKYSYALYVFHLPVVYFVAHGLFLAGQIPRLMGSQLPGLLAFSAVSGAASIALALMSWHLYEKHFLALKYRFARAPARDVEVRAMNVPVSPVC